MNETVVVDASIALKWTINEDDSNTALALLADWTYRGIEVHAPSLLAYEVTNALYRRIRKDEIPFYDARRGLTEIIYKVIRLGFSSRTQFQYSSNGTRAAIWATSNVRFTLSCTRGKQRMRTLDC